MANLPNREAVQMPSENVVLRKNDERTVVSDIATVVSATETRICGRHNVRTLPVVEGLARSGARTATLLENAQSSDLHAGALNLPIVQHAWSGGTCPFSPDIPSILVAETVQQAVDQCVVSHQLSERAGVFVLSVVAQSLCRMVGPAVLPDQAQIELLLGPATDLSRVSEKNTLRSGNWLEQTALACFTEVEGAFRRVCGPITTEGVSNTEYTVVASGDTARLARTLLRSVNQRFGLVSINQLRPLPVAAILAALPRNAHLIVPIVAGNPVDQELANSLESSLQHTEGKLPEITWVQLKEAPQDADSLRSSLEGTVPFDLPRSEKVRPLEGSVTDIRLGAIPAGEWAEKLLQEVSCSLDQDEGVLAKPVTHFEIPVTVTSSSESSSVGAAELDILTLVEDDFSRPCDLASIMRVGGAILFCSWEPDPAAAWKWLSIHERQALAAKQIEMWWLNCAELVSGPRSPELAPLVMGGVAGIMNSRWSQPKDNGVEPGALDRFLDEDETLTYEAGLKSVRRLDPGVLEESQDLPVEEIRVMSDLPRLSVANQDEDNDVVEEWRSKLREFHLNGGQRDEDDRLSTVLTPTLLEPLRNEGVFEPSFPFFLPDAATPGSRPRPLLEILQGVIDPTEQDGSDYAVLRNQSVVVSNLVAQVAGTSSDFGEAVDTALDKAPGLFDVTADGLSKLKAELETLRKSLPAAGQLIGFSEEACLHMYAWAVSRKRDPFRVALAEEVSRLVNSLGALVQSDDQLLPEAQSPESLSSTIGEEGDDFIDASALSAALPPPRGSLGLDPERRRRIEQTRAALLRFLEESDHLPRFYCVHSEPLKNTEATPGAEFIRHPRCFDLATGLYDGLLDQQIPLFKAVRVAQLEVADAYEADVHDSMLDRFTWESCTAEELLAVPPVLILDTAERLAASSLTEINRMIRSGRPLHVLILNSEPIKEEVEGEPVAVNDLPDFGYLGIAHREAFVCQASLNQPIQLLSGLEALATILRPSIAVTGVPGKDNLNVWAWIRTNLAHMTRYLPSFEYNPDSGDSWATRFSLSSNPEPEKTWVQVGINYLDHAGQEQTRQEDLTFAHMAALNPRFRSQFQLIPENAWSDEQIPLGAFLYLYEQTPPEAIPYIWVTDREGFIHRAAVTREIAHACHDRQRAWRVLQELAGLNNEYVERAVAHVKEDMAEKAESGRAQAVERARAEGAAEAVDRLIQILMNPETATQVPLSSSVAAVQQQTAGAAQVEESPGGETEVPPTQAEPVPLEEEEEDVISADPYIDSFLCTSCNDCTNLNPLVFKYNSEKQAFIADPSAGTYLQLVKAAEACPANCIHPGVPSPGDETATEQVIARAKALEL